FDALLAGEVFVIENDHDPKPLYYELLAERGNIFTWEYLEQGPEWFKVKIAKNPDEKTPQNGSIPEKDLKKAAYLKEKGVTFGCSDSGTKFPDNKDYDEWELGMLADYIVQTHHRYIKDNAESLNGLAIKVAEHHGENHPELHRVATSTHHFLQDLLNHITNEEEVLFPVIRQLLIKKDIPTEELSYDAGTLDHPIRILLKEHEIAGEDLNFLRRITNNFTPPKNACNSFTYLYEKLKEFENDLYIHLRIENDYLFPRALNLDEEVAVKYS
ncbi:MAG: hemerythrin domain-containing protein, partial [Chryseobacterium sp.]|nr:hemerythrin domain-containing protein [Chryseobacterium sp.]